ncbi:MAG: hypothetical protein WA584_05710 [Pyrinomonadaceae bacterium]
MFFQKVFAFLLCFLLVGQSLAQSKQAVELKKFEISAELKEKSIALLNNLARDAEQFYLAENRAGARILVANLLWEHDEKKARAIFQDAISDVGLMIGEISSKIEEQPDEMYQTLNPIKMLRTELLMTLAARDPKFALEALQMLGGKNAAGENLFTEDQTLELGIAAKIAEKDPKQAYELAKKNLENGLENGVFSALEDIYKKDTDLGVRLAKDIVGKIKEKKISSPYDYVGNSMSNSNRPMTNAASGAISEGSTVNVWQVQMFLDAVKRLNRLGVKDKKAPVLSDNDIKELVEMLVQKYLNQPYLSPYEVARIMPEITKYFPASAQAIRRKLANGGMELENQMRAQSIQDEIADKTSDEILQLAEKKPVEERDDFYRQAAEKAFNDGEITKAKQLYGKIKKKPEYDYFDDRIEAELPLALAKSGDLRATREMLAKLKTVEERIEVLTNLAVSVAAKGDKKTAATLTEEARSMYSGRMKQRKNLDSLLQLGYAYSTVEPAQSFALIEANLSFINDVIAAGILLDEFNEMGSVKSDEVRLEVVRAESYRNLKNGVALIRNLATSDFERTANLVDRFSRPEARFFTRLRIAEAMLDPDAEQNEKENQSKNNDRYNDY